MCVAVEWNFKFVAYNIMCYTRLTTDGEWNSLRTKGNTRLYQFFGFVLIPERNLLTQKSQRWLTWSLLRVYIKIWPAFVPMHACIDVEGGSVTAVQPNPAIGAELLHEIKNWIIMNMLHWWCHRKIKTKNSSQWLCYSQLDWRQGCWQTGFMCVNSICRKIWN